MAPKERGWPKVKAAPEPKVVIDVSQKLKSQTPRHHVAELPESIKSKAEKKPPQRLAGRNL